MAAECLDGKWGRIDYIGATIIEGFRGDVVWRLKQPHEFLPQRCVAYMQASGGIQVFPVLGATCSNPHGYEWVGGVFVDYYEVDPDAPTEQARGAYI